MLILFGVACVGVLVEAVVPRRSRNVVQLTLALLAIVAAFIVVVVERGTRVVTIGGAIAVDGPTLLLWGTLLVLGAVSLLLSGEGTVERGGRFVSQAAVTVGSARDFRQAADQPGATENCPL